MRLGEVIANAARLVRGSPEVEITRVVYDSRQAGPGALFCAVGGVKADGSSFAEDAIARGAVAVLSARELPGDFPLAVADDARRAMALCATNFYRFPAARLTMLGVTGTNGKTTVAYLVEEMAAAAGRRTGLIGTVEQRFPGVVRPSSHTTPESVDLQALLAEMVTAGAEIVSMEVSSHALAQARAVGIRFRGAAFTQLTRDHLDYHDTMENYFAAKALLFEAHLAAEGTAVIGVADEWSERLALLCRKRGHLVRRYGGGPNVAGAHVDIDVQDLKLSLAGFSGTLVTPKGSRPVHSPLTGAHNVQNALAAVGLAQAAGLPLNAIVDALATSRGAPGRLEPVIDPAGRRIFVDYAHTDDALARVLDALRKLSPDGTRIVTVFGCGGDRDRGKRPLMGQAAAERSDVVIVTSDNPRTEDATRILEDIVPGVELTSLRRETEAALRGGARGYVVIADRAEAIAAGVRVARPGDVVLIAGKGHEDYQIIGTTKHAFDDRLVARQALEAA
jgi:UDP-N-acetylmuramoyl-L-alanyl-D-glutamate--2,6-diaminopimelate ligase